MELPRGGNDAGLGTSRLCGASSVGGELPGRRSPLSGFNCCQCIGREISRAAAACAAWTAGGIDKVVGSSDDRTLHRREIAEHPKRKQDGHGGFDGKHSAFHNQLLKRFPKRFLKGVCTGQSEQWDEVMAARSRVKQSSGLELAFAHGENRPISAIGATGGLV